MALRSINLTQSKNPSADPRSNISIFGDQGVLDAPFIENTGSCQNNGVNNLYTKAFSSSESIKTISDDNRLIELKAENVSYPQVVTQYTPFTKGAATGFTGKGVNVLYINSTWIMIIERLNNKFYTSTDGVNWTERNASSLFSPNYAWFHDVTFDGLNYCFSCFETGTADLHVVITSDFVNFSSNLIFPSASGFIVDNSTIAYGNGYYNVLGYDQVYSLSRQFYSTDLVSWTLNTSTSANYRKIRFYNSEFWFFEYNTANLFHHVDGTAAFTAETCAISDVQSLIYANSKFIAIGRTTTTTDTAYSATGSTADWTAGGTLSVGHDWWGDIVWTGTYYMAFGSDLSLTNKTGIYSADGVLWFVLTLPYSYAWSGCAYNNNIIVVGSDTRQDLRINLSAGGSHTESIYRAYIDSNKTGEEMIKYGVSSTETTAVYADVKYGSSKVYGARIVGDNVEIDEINSITLARSASSSTVSASQARNCFFLRDLSASNNKHVGFNVGSTTYIYTAMKSASVAAVFTGGYYLSGGSGTSYVLLTNEIISNAAATVPSAKRFRTYSMNESTGAMTQITEKSGWFYSAVYGGTLYVCGVLDDTTDAFKVYSIDTAGVWTEVFSENANYSINGLYSEYDSYQMFSLLASLSSASFTGTAVSGRDILGYFSVIDSFTDGSNDFYLRANYNRINGTCDSLAFTVNDRYIARTIATANVDFTWRPQFHKYGTKYFVLYRDESGRIRVIVIDDIANCATQFTKISSNVFLINTLDVYNVLDCNDEVVIPTGMDYNGASLRDDTGNYNERSKIVNDIFETEYNSSETGRPPQSEEMMPGYKDQQLIYTTLTKRIYVATGDLLETTKYNSPAYMDDHGYSNIPAYAQIGNNFAFFDRNIYPLESSRPLNISFLSQVGEEYASASFFYLFGTNYMYDGLNVYLLDVDNQTATEVCRAPGVQFVTFSQTDAFFWSMADNSLWSFNGGRSLSKVTQLNQLYAFDAATQMTGDFSTRDNLLVLSKGGVVTLIYDQHISTYDDTTGTAFARENGIYYKKSTAINAISPFLYSGYSAASLKWQSAYYKADGYVTQLNEILYYIKSPTKAAGTYTFKTYTFNESQTFSVQTSTFTVTSGSYDTDGYITIRVIPQVQRCYGFSTRLETSIDCNILMVDPNIEILAEAVASANNTR